MRTFLLTLALVFTGLHSHAQVLSNNSRNSTLISQIVAAYAKAKQMGLTDEEIKYQMIKRGYTAQMFDQAKKLALSGMSSSAALTLPGGFALTEDSTAGPTPLRDTSWVFKTPMPKKPSKYFGYQYFNQAFANFSPNNSLATPNNTYLALVII